MVIFSTGQASAPFSIQKVTALREASAAAKFVLRL